MMAALTGFAADGFEIVRDVFDDGECDAMIKQLVDLSLRAGTRRLLDADWCQQVARRVKQHPVIRRQLPANAIAAQCTLFDKSTDRNWRVGWHQDVAIPVRERPEHAECRGWSIKEGVTFCQPADTVLAELVAVRVHLDDSSPENGPLRVAPGSHRQGRLVVSSGSLTKSGADEFVCTAPRGSVLLMRPLLLHASSKAEIDSPRRVLHFLFGPPRLPNGLRWNLAV